MNSGREIIVADIGGTHARFAIAKISGSKTIALDQIVQLQTIDHAGLVDAWEVFGRKLSRDLPREAMFAVAAALHDDEIRFTNSHWVLRLARLEENLGLDRVHIINDFGAVAHAAANLGGAYFSHVCGPENSFSDGRQISILGPGTGLGVAQILRHGADYHVIETESGHVEFAPVDELDDRLLQRLRKQYGRVSVERVAAGQGLRSIYDLVCERQGQVSQDLSDADVWKLALDGQDRLATLALDRFCACLGSITGDLALAHGSDQIVLTGGLLSRMGDRLARSEFSERFVAKGRFRSRMEGITVHRLTHDEPGLFGAAAAYSMQMR